MDKKLLRDYHCQNQKVDIDTPKLLVCAVYSKVKRTFEFADCNKSVCDIARISASLLFFNKNDLYLKNIFNFKNKIMRDER